MKSAIVSSPADGTRHNMEVYGKSHSRRNGLSDDGCHVCLERIPSFCNFFADWIQLSAGKIERTASVTFTIEELKDSQWVKSARVQQQQCALRVSKKAGRVCGNGAVIVRKAAGSEDGKSNARSPFAMQLRNYCTWASWQAENIAWLFFLLLANTQNLTLPCEHCWQLRLIWGLRKMLNVFKTLHTLLKQGGRRFSRPNFWSLSVFTYAAHICARTTYTCRQHIHVMQTIAATKKSYVIYNICGYICICLIHLPAQNLMSQ